MAIGSIVGRSAKDILIHIKGDDKDFQTALKKSDASMSTFTSKMQQYGPMIGAAFVTAAAGFVAMSVKMAAAEEAVSRQTEALLKSQGVMWNNVSGELDSYMKQLEDLTAYNDTDLQQAFNTMIAAGMSYTEAIESMNTVTSMSFSLNRDLASMALLVGKAYNGQTGELSRYGIVLDESLDKTEKFAGLQQYVADNFADASDRADTFEGQMEALKNETSNFAEALGAELLPGLTDFVKLLVEGSEESASFATKLGEIIAIPFDVSAASIRLKPLEEELAMLKNIEAAGLLSASSEKRKHEIIIEMMQIQNGEWENRLNYINEFGRTEKEIQDISIENEEHELILMYQKMGANDAFLNTLRNELKTKEQITAEDVKQTAEIEKQLSMRQRATSLREQIRSGTSFTGLSGTAGAFVSGEAYTRTSGAFTITKSAVRSGL